MEFKHKIIDYNKIRCLKLHNKRIEILIALNFGMRIIKFSFTDGVNILGENISIKKKVEDEYWKMRGGHRLWHSPEKYPRTYIPDNNPIEYKIDKNGVYITSGIEKHTRIKKEMTIKFLKENKIRILHRFTNKNAWEIELAVWAISVMSKNGEALIPFSKRKEDFLSTRHLEIWPYTNLQDKRLNLKKDCMYLKQKTENKEPFKLGLNNEEGWAAYKKGENIFIKEFKHYKNKKYPDNGCSFEIYTNNEILELETLSPLKKLEPNGTIDHTEFWTLSKGCELTEEGINNLLNKS